MVLTGTKLGDYRWNGHGSAGLPELIRRILAETKVERLRLSSLQPADLTPEFLALWHDGRLCPHLHLPLQSGSDTILRQMHRPYSLAEYESAVRQARDAIPDLSITTDMLVGFPGEGDSEFEESYRFCESIGLRRHSRVPLFETTRHPGRHDARPDRRQDQEAAQRQDDGPGPAERGAVPVAVPGTDDDGALGRHLR